MAEANDARIDAPKENQPKGDSPTQNIDRIDLFRSEKKEASAGAASGDTVGLKNNTDAGFLDFSQNDPFAAADSDNGDLTRGAKNSKKSAPKESSTAKPESKSDAKSEAKPGAKAEDKPAEEPFKVLNDTSNLDPNKPTVLFLDDFRKDSIEKKNDPKGTGKVETQGSEIALNNVTTNGKGVTKHTETGFTHGEFSARLAEENDFNAIRAQLNTSDSDGIPDFSKPLNGIADQIDSGKLKLGKGDVVNVSMGGVDLPFGQINQLLGSNKDNTITPENVKNPETQKDILERLGKVADDPSQPQVVRDWSKIQVDTNKAIQRLQGQGVEVLHSAANEGKDTLSLEFLSANHELASADSKTGKTDAFAPEHSKTTQANGVYPIRFQPGTEMGGGREGKYTVEGTNVKFRGEEFGNLNMQQTVSVSGRAMDSDAAVKDVFE
ncbi:MAG: hypothetical protein WCT03_07510, partial [Candidatus Obscuribacterales bacterium]